MPVVEATDGMSVLANRVHIIPPNMYMTIANGILRWTVPVERPPADVDRPFSAFAGQGQAGKGHLHYPVRTGSHGWLGLKEVKAADGLAMVQDPRTAEFPRMPQSTSPPAWQTMSCPSRRCPTR